MKKPALQVPMSAPRKWTLRLAAMVLVPLLVLAAIEAGLRLAGYGYSTSFFRPLRIGQEDFLVENDKFGLRFFPPELARSPAPVVMRAQKKPGSCRIFILGESAALGDPRPAYGAGRYLEALLKQRFPGADFEVICVAMTAINSHVLVPLARECARYQGDIWIVYMGNNEMVGPFGASTVFGSRAPSWQSVRLGLLIQRTRLGQCLMSLARKLAGQRLKRSYWGGMKMFLENTVLPQDPRKEVVYHNFERNLRDILQAAQSSGANVLLNTVAVDLKDCFPFASLQPTNLPPAEREALDTLCREAALARGQGRFGEAAQLYERATRLEPRSAELQFLWGDCLIAPTNDEAAAAAGGPSSSSEAFQSARVHFQSACDLDALPFRADSRINALIAQAANREKGPGLIFFDAAGWFATNSPEAVPGREVFYEHVHFNFDGNYRLGRAWAEQLAPLLPEGIQKQTSGEWASQELCERRLGLSDWNRFTVLQDIISRLKQPPFTGQLNHTPHLERIRAKMRQLRQRMTREAAAGARTMFEEALQREPKDHRLHENFAEFFEETAQIAESVAEWQKVRDLLPYHHVAWYQIGRLLARQGKLVEAQPPLLQALALRPDLAEGWLELGKIHALQGKEELALTEYERERELFPDDYRVYYHIGKALSKLNRGSEAIVQLRKCVQLNPDYWEGRYALGEELAFVGHHQEARAEFEKVLKLKSDYAPAHLNLGVALAQQAHWQEALGEFEETLRLEPQNKLAQSYIEKIRLGTHATTKP